LPVFPPFSMEQPGSICWISKKNLYLSIFPRFLEKIQVSFKSEKNKDYFTWNPKYIFDPTSLGSS
jgi:hypothetical protein